MSEHQTPILIVGTSVEARLALEIADQLDVLVFGFLTDKPDELNREMNDILVVAELGNKDSDTLLNDANVKLVLAASNAEDRRELFDAVKDRKPELISLVHPLARVSAHARLERGNLLFAGVIVPPNVIVGECNYFGAHVSIGVDTEIGDFGTFHDGVRIGNECHIGDDVFIGHGAIILPGVHVGTGAIIAAGSVVMQHVADETSVFGNPAKAV
jgi:sugar O-acyltransferase (sialic acid O-acetyltransferase NeuD family)